MVTEICGRISKVNTVYTDGETATSIYLCLGSALDAERSVHESGRACSTGETHVSRSAQQGSRVAG
jgi:hypothetical protein